MRSYSQTGEVQQNSEFYEQEEEKKDLTEQESSGVRSEREYDHSSTMSDLTASSSDTYIRGRGNTSNPFLTQG